MSLQHWFPLNGDINDQGIKNYTSVSNNADVNNNGKIGKCYSFSGSQRIDYTLPSSITSSIGTLACWVKFNSMPSTGGWYALMQIGTAGGFASCVFGTYIWNSSGTIYLQSSLNGSSGSSTPNNNFIYDFLPNKWYHIALIYDGTSVRHYINGELVYTVLSGAKGSYTTGTHFFIGGTNSYYLNGYMNDVRYYNNVLSDEEIKEIAKGLIFHYPLSGTPTSNLHTLSSCLPIEYQEIEYLEGTGTQWIDSQYAFINPKLSMSFCFLKTGNLLTNTWGVDFGSSPRYMHGNLWDASIYCGNSNAGSCPVDNNFIIGQITIDSSMVATINGRITTHNLNNWSGCEYTDYIFATRLNTSGSASYICPMKLYKLKFFDNTDTLVCNFIPCIRKSDNKPGLYDSIRNLFLINSGSGEFICGPAVTAWPNEYLPLESISNKDLPALTINTGVIPTATIGSIIRAKCDTPAATKERIWYGSSMASLYANGQNYALEWSSSKKVSSAFGVLFAGASINGELIEENKIFDIKFNFNGDKKLIVNNNTVYTHSVNFSSSTSPIYIFGRSVNSAADTYQGQSTIYYIQIYDGTKLIRDYRPALRISDNKPGLLELISKIFITNSSTNFKYTTHTEYDNSGHGIIASENTGLNQLNKDIIRYSKSTFFTDGSTLYVLTPDVNLPNTNTLSWSIWIKSNNASAKGSWHIPMSAYPTGGDLEISIESTGKSRVGITIEGTRKTNDYSTSIYDGVWHLIVGTYDGTNLKLYIDGILSNTIAVTGVITAKTIKMVFGKFGNSSTYGCTNMGLSDARIYATALSENEILKLYDMGRLN